MRKLSLTDLTAAEVAVSKLASSKVTKLNWLGTVKPSNLSRRQKTRIYGERCRHEFLTRAVYYRLWGVEPLHLVFKLNGLGVLGFISNRLNTVYRSTLFNSL